MVETSNPLRVVKIGGALMDDASALNSFLKHFAALPNPKVLVHGGGQQASRLAQQMGLEVQMVKGRRITTSEMLEVVVMVYGGLINKTLVAKLNALGTTAIGLSGADNQLILAHRRPPTPIDFGWVGDIDQINMAFLTALLSQKLTPVIAPITVNSRGQLLNTNADTIATEVAIALSPNYSVHLILCLDQPGVLENVHNPQSLINTLHFAKYQRLKYQGNIHSGMLPKLDNAFRALNLGVRSVRLCHFQQFAAVVRGKAVGTELRR